MIKLSHEELNEVKEEYFNGIPCKDIAVKYNISKSTLSSYIKIYNFKRERGKRSSCKGRLKNLTLLNNNEIWYWYGFIMADGHIGKDWLSIKLNKKDENHLNKLKNLFDFAVKYIKQMCYMRISDVAYIPLLQKKLLLYNTNKTKNPSDFEELFSIYPEYLYPFLIGYIDGDGCIHTRRKEEFRSLTIIGDNKCQNNFLYIQKRLLEDLDINSNVSLLKSKCYSLCFNGLENILKLKSFIYLTNIPYLERKWDSFREYSIQVRTFRKYEEEIVKLRVAAKSYSQIANILNIPLHVIKSNRKKIKEKTILCLKMQEGTL